MSIDLTNVQLSSDASSQKLIKEGTGSFSVAAVVGAGETYGSTTIAHGAGTDNLIFQVMTSNDTAGTAVNTTLPWASPDGRITTYAAIDSTNLYIYCISYDGSGFGAPARTVKYSYKILIP